jgi:Spy/CpxP family protein refolding chaperone
MKITTLIITFFTLALLLLPAKAADNSFESELFPPDFLYSQREALGLNETQLHDIQAVVQDVQPKFEAVKGQMEERGKAFRDALHEANPDIAQTEDKLRTMLTQENEMKVLQIHLMLTLRSKLTPDQVAKARELRQQARQTSASDPRQGLPERLQKKFQQLKAALDQRGSVDALPEEIVKQVKEIQSLAQGGQPLEAERKVDQLISQLGDGKPKP